MLLHCAGAFRNTNCTIERKKQSQNQIRSKGDILLDEISEHVESDV